MGGFARMRSDFWFLCGVYANPTPRVGGFHPPSPRMRLLVWEKGGKGIGCMAEYMPRYYSTYVLFWEEGSRHSRQAASEDLSLLYGPSNGEAHLALE